MKEKIRKGNVFIQLNLARRLKKVDIDTALSRFRVNDWGDIEDWEDLLNYRSLNHCGGHVKGMYHAAGGERFGIISHTDSDSPVLILPEKSRYFDECQKDCSAELNLLRG